METIVTKRLKEKEIDFVIKHHSKKVYTCEEAAIERGVKVEQIVKCMVVKSPGEKFIMALIPGNKKLNMKKFAKLLGVKKLSIASKEEVHKVTGYPIGAISPIGIRKQNVQMYIDKSVKDEELVDISSGRPDAGVELKSSDLITFLNPKMSDIAE
jgi:Cys-tRNA(Pro) deacylase